MLGFIKKDLLLIKGNLKSLIFVILIYFLLMATGDFDISFIPPFLSTMIMLSTFSYDNYNNFDAYGITLPNGRRNIVLAKYLATIILVIITTLVTYLASILISCFKGEAINYLYLLNSMMMIIVATTFVIIFMYPIVFKFGIEKARIAIFVIVFGIAIIGSIILPYLDLTNIINFLDKYGLVVLPIFVIGFSLLSYFLSLKFYLKKEF